MLEFDESMLSRYTLKELREFLSVYSDACTGYSIAHECLERLDLVSELTFHPERGDAAIDTYIRESNDKVWKSLVKPDEPVGEVGCCNPQHYCSGSQAAGEVKPRSRSGGCSG